MIFDDSEPDPRITADEYKMLLEWLSKMQDDLDELYRRLDEHTRKEGEHDKIQTELGRRPTS